MPPALSNDATLVCSEGSAPSPLVVVPKPLPTTGMGMELARVDDAVPGLNIMPFGICAILTAAAGGVPTPCVPATVAWAVPALMASEAGVPLTTVTSVCPCAVGGTIAVVLPGQWMIDLL